MKVLALVLVAACSHPKPPAEPAHTAPAPPVVAVKPPPPAPAVPPERWAATLVQGANLIDFTVVFTGPTSGHVVLRNGTLEVPIGEVTRTPDQIVFAIEKPNAPPESWEHYILSRSGDHASGRSTIGNATIPVRMVELADGEAPHSVFARPQEAALAAAGPPPYDQRELVVDAPDGGKLAGTLALPRGAGPFPVVLLLSGSGQQDRDETIFGHKPFLLVADRLARLGVATYRFDDRATGKTVGAPLSLDTEVADAGAIIDVLKKQRELDPKRVGVLGHSASGAVAPFAALAHPVAFVALMAGTTTGGGTYADYQVQHAMRKAGIDEKTIAENMKLQTAITKASLHGAKAVEAALRAVAEPQMAKGLGRKPTADEVGRAIAPTLAQATDPWTLSYFQLDPGAAWKKLPPMPVFLMVGDKDTQVPADLTIAALEAATNKRKNVVTHKLAGLNHLFQHAQTGELDEYLAIEETMDPAALELLTGWIAAQAKVRK